MALKFTLKKKDYDHDGRTVPADEFVSLMLSCKRHPDQLPDVPNTESSLTPGPSPRRGE